MRLRTPKLGDIILIIHKSLLAALKRGKKNKKNRTNTEANTKNPKPPLPFRFPQAYNQISKERCFSVSTGKVPCLKTHHNKLKGTVLCTFMLFVVEVLAS